MIYPLREWTALKNGFTFLQKYPQGWGDLTGQKHLGIDKIAPKGTPIYAPCRGIIFLKEKMNEGGNTIWFRDTQKGMLWRFLHLSAFTVAIGTINEGTTIGFVGNTGASTSSHLHLDISKNGKLELNNLDNFTDPEKYLADNVVKQEDMTNFTLKEVFSAFYKAYRGSDIDEVGWIYLENEYDKLYKQFGDKNVVLLELMRGKFNDYNFYGDLFRFLLNK